MIFLFSFISVSILSSILRFHHGSDFVLPSPLAFLFRSCLETQTELGTIRLFQSVLLDVLKNIHTLFTLRTAAFNILRERTLSM